MKISNLFPKFRKPPKHSEIKNRFPEGAELVSLSDGKTYKYSGYLTMVQGKDIIAFDSFNKNLVIYKNGKFSKP